MSISKGRNKVAQVSRDRSYAGYAYSESSKRVDPPTMTKGTKSSSKTTSHNKDSPKIHNTHCPSSTIPFTATLCPQAPARHSHAFFIISNTYTASLFTYKNPPPASSPSHTQTHNTFPFPSRKHQITKTPIHPPTPTHITPHPPLTAPPLTKCAPSQPPHTPAPTATKNTGPTAPSSRPRKKIPSTHAPSVVRARTE
jgi:hypothetical protein